MVNSGTTAGQHDTPQRTSTYERPFTCEGNYLVSFFWPFSFCSASTGEIVSVATESSSFAVSSFLYGYCCVYFAQSLGILFSGSFITLIIQLNLVRFSEIGSYSLVGTAGSCINTALNGIPCSQ